MTGTAKRVMLVMIAVLFGIIAGLVAAVLASTHGPESAVFSGSGAFVAASLFVIKIESALGLFESEAKGN